MNCPVIQRANINYHHNYWHKGCGGGSAPCLIELQFHKSTHKIDSLEIAQLGCRMRSNRGKFKTLRLRRQPQRTNCNWVSVSDNEECLQLFNTLHKGREQWIDLTFRTINTHEYTYMAASFVGTRVFIVIAIIEMRT